MGICKYVSTLRYSFWRKTHQLPRPKDLNLDWPAAGFMHPCHGFSRTPGTGPWSFRFRQLSYPNHVEFTGKIVDFHRISPMDMVISCQLCWTPWEGDGERTRHVPFVDDLFLNSFESIKHIVVCQSKCRIARGSRFSPKSSAIIHLFAMKPSILWQLGSTCAPERWHLSVSYADIICQQKMTNTSGKKIPQS